MNDGKLPGGSRLEPKSEFGKKLDNFWYYNKWKVLAGIFALFVVIVCAVQCESRENYSVRIMYGGALSSSNEKTQDMRAAFDKIKPASAGKDSAGLTVMEIYSDEYLANPDNSANASMNASNYDSFCKLITSGEYSLLLVDKWIYDALPKGSIGFRAISEVCGEAGISAGLKYDDCAVYFKQTDYYKANAEAFGALPDDVLICLCIYSPYKSTLSCAGSSPDSDYIASEDMLRAIMSYKIN